MEEEGRKAAWLGRHRRWDESEGLEVPCLKHWMDAGALSNVADVLEREEFTEVRILRERNAQQRRVLSDRESTKVRILS